SLHDALPISPIVVMDSGLAAARRPGMTGVQERPCIDPNYSLYSSPCPPPSPPPSSASGAALHPPSPPPAARFSAGPRPEIANGVPRPQGAPRPHHDGTVKEVQALVEQ